MMIMMMIQLLLLTDKNDYMMRLVRTPTCGSKLVLCAQSTKAVISGRIVTVVVVVAVVAVVVVAVVAVAVVAVVVVAVVVVVVVVVVAAIIIMMIMMTVQLLLLIDNNDYMMTLSL